MKNWTVKEAVAVISAGTDKEAIKEIVKHFPLFAVIAAGKDFNGLAQAMPESLTVRKVETVLNAGATATDVDTDEEVDTDGEVAEEAGEEKDLTSMTKNELIALCESKGLKVQKHQKPKQYYIDALNNASDTAEVSEEAEEDEDGDEEKAVELFKKCKKAGIKVPKGKDAKFYQAKLDELESEDDDEDEDDDWGEDEEVEEKPKKADKKKAGKKEEKKADKKAAKKSKKVEPEEDTDDDEDDDDDWDI